MSEVRKRKAKKDASDAPLKGVAADNSQGKGKGTTNDEQLQAMRCPEIGWGFGDIFILLVFLALAVGTRFYQIEVPQGIVWDETHFTKFLTWYFTGHYFVDIHPPLAKMIHALALRYLTDFVGAQEIEVEWWTNNGFIGTTDWELLYHDEHGKAYIAIRRVSAVAGVLLVLVTYLTVRAVGCGRLAAILGTWLILLENLVLLQSRLILTDVFLYLFNMATYGASFYSVRPMSLPKQIFWVTMTGVMLGCSISVKYTALGTLGLVGVHQAWNLLLMYFTLPIKSAGDRFTKVISTGVWKAALMLSVALIVFFGLWIVHIYVLPYDGQGTGFMNEEFKQTLKPKLKPDMIDLPADACPNHANAWSDCGFGGINQAQCEAKGCCYDPTSPRNWCYHKGHLVQPQMSMFAKIREILRATWANNDGADLMVHPHMSEWWEWPVLNCRQVPFGTVGPKGKIISLGNPAVWWGVALFFVLSLILGVLGGLWQVGQLMRGRVFGISHWMGVFLTLWIGYVGNIVPYVMIPRSKFVYHYIPALEVGCLIWAVSVEMCFRATKNRNAIAKSFASLIFLASIVVVGAAFWYWAPWTYGWELSRKEHNQRRWVHKWGHGFL